MPVLVRSHVGHVGHGERVKITAFAGGDDLPAGNGLGYGLPLALPVRLDDDVASETDLTDREDFRAIALPWPRRPLKNKSGLVVMCTSYVPQQSNWNSSRESASTPMGGPGINWAPEPATNVVSTPARPVLV